MSRENEDSQTTSFASNESADGKRSGFRSYGMTTEEVLALTVLNSGISVIGTISNILVIFVVLLNRQLRQTCTAIL